MEGTTKSLNGLQSIDIFFKTVTPECFYRESSSELA